MAFAAHRHELELVYTHRGGNRDYPLGNASISVSRPLSPSSVHSVSANTRQSARAASLSLQAAARVDPRHL